MSDPNDFIQADLQTLGVQLMFDTSAVSPEEILAVFMRFRHLLISGPTGLAQYQGAATGCNSTSNPYEVAAAVAIVDLMQAANSSGNSNSPLRQQLSAAWAPEVVEVLISAAMHSRAAAPHAARALHTLAASPDSSAHSLLASGPVAGRLLQALNVLLAQPSSSSAPPAAGLAAATEAANALTLLLHAHPSSSSFCQLASDQQQSLCDHLHQLWRVASNGRGGLSSCPAPAAAAAVAAAAKALLSMLLSQGSSSSMASCVISTPGVVQGFITALGQQADPALSATAAQALQLMASDRSMSVAMARLPGLLKRLAQLLQHPLDGTAAAAASILELILSSTSCKNFTSDTTNSQHASSTDALTSSSADITLAAPELLASLATTLNQASVAASRAVTAAQLLTKLASTIRLPTAAPAKPAVVAGLVELLKLESEDPAAAVVALEALIALMVQDASVGRLFVQTKKAWPLLVKVLRSDLQLVAATTNSLPSHAVHPTGVTTASSEQQPGSCPASGQPHLPAATRAPQQLPDGGGGNSSSTVMATSTPAKELSPGNLSSVLVILAVEAVHHLAYVPAALTLLHQSKPAIVGLVQLFATAVAAAQQQQQQSAALIKVSLHCASALLLSAQQHGSTRVALELSPLDLQQLDLAVRLAPARLDGQCLEVETFRGAITAVNPEQVLGIAATDDRTGGVFKALQHLWASWTRLREAVAQAPLGQAMGSHTAGFLVAPPAADTEATAQQQRQVSIPGLQTLLPSQPCRHSPAPPAAPSRKRQYPVDDAASGDLLLQTVCTDHSEEN